MRLRPYIRSDLVVAELKAADRRQAVERLVDVLLQAYPALDRQQVLGRLYEREKAISTGLESGVAVPHATMDGLSQTVLAIGRLAEPVDFDALDGEPVRILFLLLSPPDATATHIRLLARIARLCSKPGFLGAMLAAGDADELFSVIQQEDAQHV